MKSINFQHKHGDSGNAGKFYANMVEIILASKGGLTPANGSECIIMKNMYYAGLVFLGGCCYGILSTFVKIAYANGFSSAAVTGAQYLFGTMMLWLVLQFTKKEKLSVKEAVKLLSSGIPFGLTGIFYYQALQSLSASLAIVFLFQFVWIGSVIEWLVYRRVPDKTKLISIAVLLLGSLLAADIFSSSSTFTLSGLMWGIMAAVSFATFLFLSSAVGSHLPPVQKSALLATGASILVSICYPPVFILEGTTFFSLAPYGLLLGLFGVVLPPLLYSIGMPHVGPSLGTILTSSELPVAILMSSVVLSEPVPPVKWTGVILILIGISLNSLKDSKKTGMLKKTEYQ